MWVERDFKQEKIAMSQMQRWTRKSILVGAFALIAGCASMGGGDVAITMTGAEQVPPVKTAASGSGSVRVGDDGAVSGRFRTQNIAPTAAHIHEAPAGQNGPVIVTLRKTGDNDWVVPDGAKFTPAQVASYKAGRLYVNFHTPANKGGEIRGQIRP